MTDSLSDQQTATAARSQAHALFAQPMCYVVITARLFVADVGLGRGLADGAAELFIVGFGAT
jgi:hypothetical protein